MTSSPPPNGPPSTADYLVGPCIGEGAFGSVLLGRHKASQTWVAIKVVSKARLLHQQSNDKKSNNNSRLLQCVLQEQRLLAQWNDHPHIVKLLASFHDTELVYLVMEPATRGTLQDMLLLWERSCCCVPQQQQQQQQQMSATAASYALQLVRALEFLHSHRVIHADLSPSNVLIHETGRLQLCDFGGALVLDNVCTQTTTTTTWIEPFFQGTADYASPEVIQGTVIDAANNATIAGAAVFGVDLWSLGCLCFAMLMGTSPFHAASDALAVQRIQEFVNGEMALTRVVVQTQESLWNDLIAGLLHPDPSRRWGVSDHTCVEEDDNKYVVTYTTLRSHIRKLQQEQLDASTESDYLPPHAPWYDQAERSTLRDGKLGWPAFVL